MIISQIKLARTLLVLGFTLFFVGACGSEGETREDGEHVLSEQQQALERAKTTAEAMEKAAAQRAAQTAPQSAPHQ